MVDKEKMKQRMIDAKLYVASKLPPEPGKELIDKFNASPRSEAAIRTEKYLKPLFGAMGKDCYIEAPIYLDHGYNVYLGDDVYMNTDCIILDQCPVKIGSNTLIGPRVNFYCAIHPMDAFVRNLLVEGGKPITVGENCWIGGSTTICPGVTIGDNVVIGAGSVVVKDIPSNTVAVGNPCKVVREITEKDREYWMEQLAEFESDTGMKMI